MIHHLRVFTGVILLTCIGGLAGQQFKTMTRPGLPSGKQATFKLAVGDVNGDGMPDIVYANMGTTVPGTQNQLYLADGKGGYVDATKTNLPVKTDWSGAVVLADLDGDSDLDIVFGNLGGDSKLYLNDGKGVFKDAGTKLPYVPTTIYAIVAGDVDGDKDLDLVMGFYVLLNDGKATFKFGTSLPVQKRSWGSAIGDVDSDGDLDVIVGGFRLQPNLFLNDGKGVFSDGTSQLPPMFVDVRGNFGLGDVDGDKDLDIYFPNINGQNRLYLNDGKGKFTDVTSAQLPQVSTQEYASVLGDVDNDGDLDAMTAGTTGAVATQNKIYLNDGKGTFSDDTKTRVPSVSDNSVCCVLADMDLDGDLDFVIGNWEAQNTLWINLHRHTYAQSQPRIGRNYALDFYGLPGYATVAQAVVAFGGLVLTPRVLVSPYGYLGVHPVGLFLLPSGVIKSPGGKFTMSLPIPNDSNFRGFELAWQGLILQKSALRLTNAFVDKVR